MNKCVFEHDENSAYHLDSTIGQQTAEYKEKIILQSELEVENCKLEDEISQNFDCVN